MKRSCIILLAALAGCQGRQANPGDAAGQRPMDVVGVRGNAAPEPPVQNAVTNYVAERAAQMDRAQETANRANAQNAADQQKAQSAGQQ